MERSSGAVIGTPFFSWAQPEEDQPAGVEGERMAEVAVVITVELVVISLEVERIVGGLPFVCFSPSIITVPHRSAKLNFIRLLFVSARKKQVAPRIFVCALAVAQFDTARQTPIPMKNHSISATAIPPAKRANECCRA